jgi:hypothetical protein
VHYVRVPVASALEHMTLMQSNSFIVVESFDTFSTGYDQIIEHLPYSHLSCLSILS